MRGGGVYIQFQTTEKGNKWRAVYVLFRVLNLETLINGIRENLKEEKETKENWSFDSTDRNFEILNKFFWCRAASLSVCRREKGMHIHTFTLFSPIMLGYLLFSCFFFLFVCIFFFVFFFLFGCWSSNFISFSAAWLSIFMLLISCPLNYQFSKHTVQFQSYNAKR